MSKAPRVPSPKPHGRAKRSVKLFISYSHQNRYWMQNLEPILDSFEYDDRRKTRSLERLDGWHDKELIPGKAWDEQIKHKLAEMDIFVPLISTQFFASPYIQTVELPVAKKRHEAGEILVVPILLYDVNLKDKCSFLHSFSTFPATGRCWKSFADPFEAQPLIDDGLWAAIDEALKRPRK